MTEKCIECGITRQELERVRTGRETNEFLLRRAECYGGRVHSFHKVWDVMDWMAYLEKTTGTRTP
jgi:hypothetical protein